MANATTSTGIAGIGNVNWGSHLCQFFQSRAELIDSLVSFYAAGLRNNECCMMGTGSPFYANEVESELAKVLPDIRERIRRKQMNIFDHHDWYVGSRSGDAMAELRAAEEQALANGYEGLRCGGNISWITKKDWPAFLEYERRVSRDVRNRRILALCSYDVSRCEGFEVFDVIHSHHFTVAKPVRSWELFEMTTRT